MKTRERSLPLLNIGPKLCFTRRAKQSFVNGTFPSGAWEQGCVKSHKLASGVAPIFQSLTPSFLFRLDRGEITGREAPQLGCQLVDATFQGGDVLFMIASLVRLPAEV